MIYICLDNISVSIDENYNPGDSTLRLSSGSGDLIRTALYDLNISQINTNRPLIFYLVEHSSGGVLSEGTKYVEMTATGLSGDVLQNVSVVSGYLDQPFYLGDIVTTYWSAVAYENLVRLINAG